MLTETFHSLPICNFTHLSSHPVRAFACTHLYGIISLSADSTCVHNLAWRRDFNPKRPSLSMYTTERNASGEALIRRPSSKRNLDQFYRVHCQQAADSAHMMTCIEVMSKWTRPARQMMQRHVPGEHDYEQ
eukprot:6212384-Pleurochrysis_carterae.AAC.1